MKNSVVGPRRSKAFAPAMLPTLGILFLSGCGVGLTAPQADQSIAALQGAVHGGNQPVQNAYVAVYATSSSGYNGTVTQIANTTTDANGSFDFSTTPTCPAGQFAYLLAAGGNPGLTSGTNNQAIVLMAPLGSCASLSSLSFVTINEVTTVASAYALSGFLPSGGAGITYSAITGGNAMPGVTTSSTNVQGLTDGFANALSILNLSTGLANTTTPTGGIVPQGTLHAIADILQNCVNSSGPTSTSCTGTNGSLTAATPPSGSGIATPASSLQAAVDIAQYPGNNVSGLFNLLSSSPAFSTNVTAAPNDWTVGIAYNSALISNALGMTIDNYDNVWVSGSANGDLLEFSPQGAPLSPTATVAAVNGSTSTLSAVPAQAGWLQNVTFVNGSSTGDNIRTMAFDTANNLWMADGDQGKTTTFVDTGVLEYVPGGTPTAPTQGTASVKSYTSVDANYNTYAIAADKLGDVWTSSYKKSTCRAYTVAGTGDCNLVEFVPTAYTPYATFGTGAYQSLSVDGTAGSRGLAVDSSANSPGAGNIWTTDIGFAKVGLFQATLKNGSAASASANQTAITVGSGTDATYGVAIDSASDAWVVGTTSGNLYKISPTGTVLNTYATSPAMYAAAYDVVDGNNNIFIASNIGSSPVKISTVVEFSSALGAFAPPTVGFSPSASGYAAGTSGATFTTGTGLLYEANDFAIDRSGALWVLGTGAYSATAPYPSALIQILGVAAPTNPVLAFGQYGVKP